MPWAPLTSFARIRPKATDLYMAFCGVTLSQKAMFNLNEKNRIVISHERITDFTQ
jgi:hypothetical protein